MANKKCRLAIAVGLVACIGLTTCFMSQKAYKEAQDKQEQILLDYGYYNKNEIFKLRQQNKIKEHYQDGLISLKQYNQLIDEVGDIDKSGFMQVSGSEADKSAFENQVQKSNAAMLANELSAGLVLSSVVAALAVSNQKSNKEHGDVEFEKI